MVVWENWKQSIGRIFLQNFIPWGHNEIFNWCISRDTVYKWQCIDNL